MAEAQAAAPPADVPPPDSPYYLSSGDQMNLVLVSDRLTDALDYNSWCCSVTMALEGRNKLGFVDGSLPKPAETDPNLKHWLRNNAIIKSWLLNSVSKTITISLMYAKSARDIWLNLG
ncbi:PREDICTED: uncharacterized protein LOC104799735 [Tarenaya hassleriana]|nr:PREDICTED: uncharacterized protein LOC104799735 [Tarenaya hassleriana]